MFTDMLMQCTSVLGSSLRVENVARHNSLIKQSKVLRRFIDNKQILSYSSSANSSKEYYIFTLVRNNFISKCSGKPSEKCFFGVFFCFYGPCVFIV